MGTSWFVKGAGVLIAMGLLGTSAATAAYDPGKIQAHGIYMEVVNYQDLENGNFEYVIDCYTDGSTLGDYMLWGFHNAEIQNLHDGLGGWDPDYQSNIYQRWDGTAAGENWGPPYGSDPELDYPSYAYPGGSWQLSETPYEMINDYHQPTDYSEVYQTMSCAYDIDAGQTYGGGHVAGEDGLYMTPWFQSFPMEIGLLWTLRVVVPGQGEGWVDPDEPGGGYGYGGGYYENDLWWSLPALGSQPEGDHGTGGIYPVLNMPDIPPPPPPPDLHPDEFCGHMGEGPSSDYDLDGDGDVDEDDFIIFIELYVEWDNGVTMGNGTYRGDFNLDGVVNATDLQRQRNGFGQQLGWDDGNANCDLWVNATDLQILKANFGQSVAGTVPEPLTTALLAAGMAAILRRRRGEIRL